MNTIRITCRTAQAILLVSVGALAFAAAPALAQPGANPVQLAQSEANLPDKSPEQEAAEKKLEKQKDDLEGKLDKERDDFLKSKEGKEARDKVEKKRKEMEKKKKELEKAKKDFENDPDSRSCCNPGYKAGVLRHFDGQIKKLEDDFEKERKKIADDEMKKKDKKRAAAADKIREAIKQLEAALKRLRELPPMPPPGLTWGGFPDDGVVVLAMLPGVSFAGASDPGSDPRVRRALMDQGVLNRIPPISVPRIPTMQTHMPSMSPNVEVMVPRPPMEVIPR